MEPFLQPATRLPVFRPSCGPGVPECFIANPRPGQPVLVAVHGISRNAAEIAMRFAIHPAFAHVTIVAPLFTSEGFGQYQQLQPRSPDQTPADDALIRLMDVLSTEHAIATRQFALFGFSGGAQMIHRFALFHPRRVTRLCLASAGWYSLPRSDLAYPYDIGDPQGAPLVGPEFLDIPTTVLVGNRDTRVDASVRQDDMIVEHQGRNRLRRARCFVRASSAYAESMGKSSRCRLRVLDGMSHDFNQCVTEGDLIEVAARALL